MSERRAKNRDARALLQAVEDHQAVEEQQQHLATHDFFMPIRWTFAPGADHHVPGSHRLASFHVARSVPRSVPPDLFACLHASERLLLNDSGVSTEEAREHKMYSSNVLSPPSSTTAASHPASPSARPLPPARPPSPAKTPPSAKPPPPPPNDPFPECPRQLSRHLNLLHAPLLPYKTSASVVYLCESCPRLLDNCALAYALWISRKHQLPILVVMIISVETLLGKSPASHFLNTAFGRFASILQTKLGIPVLSICCVNSTAHRNIMREIIQCYQPHTVVVDNSHNQSTRAWPLPPIAISEWCHSLVVEANSSCLVELTTWKSFQDDIIDANKKNIKNNRKSFDLNCVQKSVGEWRASSELTDILALGIGLIPGQQWQPEVQNLLFQTDNEGGNNCSVPPALLHFFNGTTDAVLLSLNELLSSASTRVDKSTDNHTQAPSNFCNSREGSESSALFAVSTLIRTLTSASSNDSSSTSKWTESTMRMLDCNPSQVGQEQLMNYLNLGSLSPRVLVDLMLGHRVKHRQEPYQWMEWLTHPDQCLGTTWRGTGLFEHVERGVSGCASYCIYNSISCREFDYMQFVESLQQTNLKAVSNQLLAPLTSKAMWKTFVCVGKYDANKDILTPLSTENHHLVGSLERSSTPDEVFNILQFRLVKEGQIHPVCLKTWIICAEQLLHNPFLSFHFVITMIRKYHFGASRNFDFLLSKVVHTYQNQREWKKINMVENGGREFWESMKRKYQCH